METISVYTRARQRWGLRLLWLLGGLCLCWGGRIGLLEAHGGGTPVVSAVPSGPFVLYAWIEPWPAETGELHVTVSVNAPAPDDAERKDPVLQANVVIQAMPADNADRMVQAVATHEQAANKLFYEGRLVLPTPGVWNLQLRIDAQQGTTTHELPIEVTGAALDAIPEEQEPVAGTESGNGEHGFLGRLLAWFRSLFAS